MILFTWESSRAILYTPPPPKKKKKKKKLFVWGFMVKTILVGRLASFFFYTFVQLPKKHFQFKNSVKQASCKSYKAISAIACNF